MIESIITVLAVSFLGYYLMFLWDVKRGLGLTTRPFNSATPFVSVIVAARNEESHIERCLTSLIRQHYHRDKYEIIVVDDHSRDLTLVHAQTLAANPSSPRITVVTLADSSSEHGKPAAIARGVEISMGDVILCTDADCVVPPGWIDSMVGCFEPSVAFVAGPVFEQSTGSLLSRLQSLEFLSIIITAAGLIGSRKPIVCNGASIGYRRNAFLQVSGYGDLASSCDDETLMQRMLKRSIGRVIFNADPQAAVVTSTPSTVTEFWQQRTRWASKRGRYEDKNIIGRLIGLYCFFLVVFLLGLSALFAPSLRIPLLGIVLVKLLTEFFVLRAGARMLRQEIELRHFLIAELFHVPYIVFAALIGQIRSIRWKDRELTQ